MLDVRSPPCQVGEIRGYRFLKGSFPDRERLPDHDARYLTSSYPLSAFVTRPGTRRTSATWSR